MTYLVNFLLVLVYYLIIKKVCKPCANRVFSIVVALHAILFRALANPYNYVDTEVYAAAFSDIASMPFLYAISPINVYADWGLGFVFVNWLIGQFSSNPQTMFVIMSVIGLVPVFFFFYKTSDSLLLSIVFYLLYPMFFYMSFGVIRQHVAIGFTLMALYSIDNMKRSLLWAVLALSFHTSAIVFFPFYIWRHVNKSIGNVMWNIVLIMSTVLIAKAFLGGFLSSSERYDTYYGVQSEERNIIPVFFIGSLLLLLYCSGAYRHITSPLDKNIWNFMLYGFAMSLVGIGTYGMGRMTLYFMYVFPVAITLLEKYRIDKSVVSMAKGVMLIIVIYLMMGAYNEQPYSYSFFWEQVTRTW